VTAPHATATSAPAKRHPKPAPKKATKVASKLATAQTLATPAQEPTVLVFSTTEDRTGPVIAAIAMLVMSALVQIFVRRRF